jgi:ATP-dependent DNA helicase RecG
LIAEPLFRVKYVEKAGTGTTDMIADCRKVGLPEPDFEQRGPHFVVTLWRDWLTEKILSGLDLNQRQMKAIQFLKSEGSISSADFQSLTIISRQTASRDLEDLVKKNVLVRQGKGRGTIYIISKRLPHK